MGFDFLVWIGFLWGSTIQTDYWKFGENSSVNLVFILIWMIVWLSVSLVWSSRKIFDSLNGYWFMIFEILWRKLIPQLFHSSRIISHVMKRELNVKTNCKIFLLLRKVIFSISNWWYGRLNLTGKIILWAYLSCLSNYEKVLTLAHFWPTHSNWCSQWDRKLMKKVWI